MAKPGEKIKVPIFIRRKGADAFRPALAAGGSLMAYKCLSLCRFRGFTAGFCKNFVQRFQKFKMRFQGKAKEDGSFRQILFSFEGAIEQTQKELRWILILMQGARAREEGAYLSM